MSTIVAGRTVALPPGNHVNISLQEYRYTDRNSLALTVIARAWVIQCLCRILGDMELTISMENIREPFEYSGNSKDGNYDPFHPGPSSSDVDSPA
jgi:hypothetical protein